MTNLNERYVISYTYGSADEEYLKNEDGGMFLFSSDIRDPDIRYFYSRAMAAVILDHVRRQYPNVADGTVTFTIKKVRVV